MSGDFKAVVGVAEMARMCELSRARFYQLTKAGVFPPPERDPESGRPLYTEALQRVCLEVRRRNRGVNGQPILFYAPRTKRRKAASHQPRNNQHSDLIEALKALGLTTVTPTQVETALKEVYPRGTSGVNDAEVIRAVFLHLRR